MEIRPRTERGGVSYLQSLPPAQRKSTRNPLSSLADVARQIAVSGHCPVISPLLKEALQQVKYPGFSRDIVSFGLVREAVLEGGDARVALALTTADPHIPAVLKADIEKALRALPGVRTAAVEVSVSTVRTPPAQGAASASAARAGIARAVAIASGKGGVGKSTFAVNVACALAQILAERGAPGNRVGLLDCDIYGPTVPLMIGLHGRPEIVGENEEAQLLPMENHGVKVMSMGFLIDDDTPVIWRGPMIMKTVQQFIQNVRWGDLAILLVDLPPGTGDAQLSLVQTLPLDGAVLVTTPQRAATDVARRGGLMFQKVNVPLLGVAENMSYFVDAAGRRQAVFGEGGGAATAASLGAPFLGQVPLLQEIREGGDRGVPIVVSDPSGHAAVSFRTIAQSLLDRIPPASR